MKLFLLNARGSILVEGCLVVFLLLMVVLIQVELSRRVWIGTILQLAAFEAVRNEMMGFNSGKNAVKIDTRLNRSISFLFKDKQIETLNPEFKVVSSAKELVALFHIRYPALINLKESHLSKNHFEVTEKCRFPFLLH